ncbi:MAG: GDP-mannose 4,6-dehydratase, partial [Alphaproteobacteria bacterium]
EWEGKGADEVGIDAKSGRVIIGIDPIYFRPTEVDFLLGDPSKARRQLDWHHTTSFEELVTDMVHSDLLLMSRQKGRNDVFA